MADRTTLEQVNCAGPALRTRRDRKERFPPQPLDFFVVSSVYISLFRNASSYAQSMSRSCSSAWPGLYKYVECYRF